MTRGIRASVEREQWRKVIRRLIALDAITHEDFIAPPHQGKTPGQKLLSDIAYWGELKAAQMLAEAHNSAKDTR